MYDRHALASLLGRHTPTGHAPWFVTVGIGVVVVVVLLMRYMKARRR